VLDDLRSGSLTWTEDLFDLATSVMPD
jgi:hypothetical protein